MATCMVLLAEIDKDLRPASLTRASLNEERIATYAEIIDDMDAVELVYDPVARLHWVADGSHRISAARKAGKSEIQSRVRQGSYLDAFHRACHANARHGLHVTNADKRRRVEEALEALVHHPKWPMPLREIAEWCGVGHELVRQIRGQLSSDDNRLDAFTEGRDGKRYPIAKKPRKPAEPKPAPTPPVSEEVPPDTGRVVVVPETRRVASLELPDDEPAKGRPEVNGHAGEHAVGTPTDGYDLWSAWMPIERTIFQAYEATPTDYRVSFVEKLESVFRELTRVTTGFQSYEEENFDE